MSARSEILPRRSLLLVAGWLLILALVTALTWRDFDAFQTGVYRDDASYLVLGRSLAHGEPYSLATGPGPTLETSYPFVFPLALSVVERIAPGSLSAGRWVSLIASLVALSCLFWGWRLLAPRSSRRAALAITALVGLSPTFLPHARMIMTDATFAALVFAALVFAETCLQKEGRRRTRFLLLGALLASVALCRLVGWAAVVGVVLRLATARPAPRRSAWILLAAGFLAVAMAFLSHPSISAANFWPRRALQSFARPSQRGQDARNDSLLPRVLLGAQAFGGTIIRRVLLPVGSGEREARLVRRLGVPALSGVLSWGVTGLVLLGFLVQWRRAELVPSVLYFQIFYAALLLLWPWRMERFLLPVLPFLLFELLAGVAWLAAALVRFARRPQRTALVAGRVARTAAIAALLAISLFKSAAPAQDSRDYVRDYEVEGRWLRENTPRDAVLLAMNSAGLHLYAQRPTVDASFFPSRAALAAAVERYGVDFIVVEPALQWRLDGTRVYHPFTRRQLLPFAEGLVNAGRGRLVFSAPTEKVRIYQVLD